MRDPKLEVKIGVIGRVVHSNDDKMIGKLVHVVDDAESTGGFLIYTSSGDPKWPWFDGWVQNQEELMHYFEAGEIIVQWSNISGWVSDGVPV
ncbi:MAG TPA: hypothetical protein VHL98_03595 [Microvirga sp.]|jgi:hypothetical protein|nr:hypothetical protein [Microvirga sp.]